MDDKELDMAIAERFKAYEAGIHLPDEFKGRLVCAVRRKRVWRHIWMLGLICATAVACAAIVNFARPNIVRGDMRPALIANAGNADETAEVSCWMLLGCLRECFSRSRSARRKEEE